MTIVKNERAFQERVWKAERLGWALFGLILVLALLGFTGKGGYWSTVNRDAGAIAVEHPRVARSRSAETVTLHLLPSANERGFALPEAFFSLFRLEDVEPAPHRTQHQSGSRLFFYPAGHAPLTVRLHAQPNGVGSARFALSALGGDSVQISIFVLP